MKTPYFSVLALLVALMFTACNSKVMYENTISISEDGWNQDKFLIYTVPAVDTINPYEISLIVRNDSRYEYSNLFLFINTTAPSGMWIRDTIEITLADEMGNWKGRGIGGKHTLVVPFKTQVVFPQTGNFTMEVEQGMRAENLEYITDIGVSIKKMN